VKTPKPRRFQVFCWGGHALIAGAPSPEPFLDTFAGWAKTRGDILGVAVVGSYARGTTSPTSDLDLLVLTTSPVDYLETPAFTFTAATSTPPHRILASASSFTASHSSRR